MIEAIADDVPAGNELTLGADQLAARRLSSSDTASLLPGVDAAHNGGVSSLPMIHGLGDDRNLTLVNGVPVAAACPMHMNPPLSYIDPANVARIAVLPGVTPVSLGGDSIGGTILVDSAAPAFAATDGAVERHVDVSNFYRSNSAAVGGAAAATMASSDFSLAYQGSGSRAGDYRDADGERINASRFETSNQQVTAAYRSGQNQYEAQAALQYMPYEGFPNADMDLSGNVGAFINARYQGGYDWGELSMSAYYNRIRHQMNGNAPDRYAPSPVDITSMGLMPTRERARDFGYRIEADIATSARDELRVGNELQVQSLDDRWPGAPIGMMFDYINLNAATRTRLGSFAEWERRWGATWSTLLGARNDTVWMNTGPVQGYDGIDPTAEAFNASHRARTDVNVDASLLSRYQPDDQQSYSLGLARKNRSPNFYERYAWGTNTIGMVSWFGDGNGYTGNPDLKPETALTASILGDWHDPGARLWDLKLTPYYTSVQDYIGVVPICGPACTGTPASQLMFANQRARLYGIDATGAVTLSSSPASGTFRLTGAGGLVRGQDLSTHTHLYHMMPLHGTIALEHQLGRWSSALQLHAVEHKSEVDEIRLEPQTPGYAILDLRTAYEWRSVRLDLAATNLLGRQYQNPLGGTWQSALYPPGYAGATFRPLPAQGRSFDAGVTLRF
ncbi:MAG TPA: TonB-dependent receptor [Steroidobacteraceae bacterium]|nr:TonB-dependent receptor [Steroidobacteraceae bacterium]